MTRAPAQNATIESVHRAMNERRQKRTLRTAGLSMRSECECDRVECGSGFTASLADYDNVRSIGCRFMVAPGHQRGDESVVSTEFGYLVVDKVGAQGRSAELLNPR
jgi:hypothetical protein